MTYEVRFESDAADDLDVFWTFIAERDLEMAAAATYAFRRALLALGAFPYSFPKVDEGFPFVREMLIPFGPAGYVVLYEIGPGERVTILAVRYQRDEDYY